MSTKDLKTEQPCNLHSVMLSAGFKRELIGWSFIPKFYDKDDGYYYSKYVPSELKDSYTDEIEIGIIINEQYNSMEVYMCDCHVGCCGRDLGIHPFSLDKVDKLLKDERAWLADL
tara:strand:+ start:141 stop:485 length:345 start_codon:yes stop_codon:yes gene_type:complete